MPLLMFSSGTYFLFEELFFRIIIALQVCGVLEIPGLRFDFVRKIYELQLIINRINLEAQVEFH